MANKDNNKEGFSKMSINWYPGHMAKTKKQIAEDLKLIDVVVEILDARIPVSSQNPDVANIIENKKRIIVLNKSDLADDTQNKLWKDFFTNKGIPTIVVNSNTGAGTQNIIKEVKNIMQEDLTKQEERGRVNKNIRIMIVRNTQCGKIFSY